MTKNLNQRLYAVIALLFICLGSTVPLVVAQENPARVIIWCQDSSGNFGPCLAGNSIDYDTGGGTVAQGTIGFALPAPGGPVAGGTVTNPIVVGVVPITTGGTVPCYITSSASTNATNCKASAGQVYGYRLINTTATIYYLRMYNLASTPTCSSATGFIQTIPVPASTTGGGVVSPIPIGEAYSAGIGFCLTGGGSSTDNTSAGIGVYITVNYK